jgi:hypothetical protein
MTFVKANLAVTRQKFVIWSDYAGERGFDAVPFACYSRLRIGVTLARYCSVFKNSNKPIFHLPAFAQRLSNPVLMPSQLGYRL